jgi:hypothetical protein
MTEINYKELLRMAHEQLDSQSAMIYRLNKELSSIVAGLFSEDELEIHNLEQQAKGVRDFFTNHPPRISMGKSAIWEVDDVLVDECIDKLTTKSKALKDQS